MTNINNTDFRYHRMLAKGPLVDDNNHALPLPEVGGTTPFAEGEAQQKEIRAIMARSGCLYAEAINALIKRKAR